MKFNALTRCFSIVALVAVMDSACGSKPAPPPTGPSGPSAPAPQLACSGDISVVGRGPTQPAAYLAPTVSGGVAPVATACTPASGAQFPIGTTNVICTATDAAAQTGACTFAVRVHATTISLKKFQSIGDSLTLGENGLPFQVSVIDAANAYPTKLRNMLEAAFPSQGIILANRGFGGERIEATLSLLPGYLASDRPEVVMLLGGYNNLILPCHDGITIADAGCDAAVEFLEDTLREIVHEAKRFSSVRHVLVSTLTPSGPIATDAQFDRRIDRTAIVEANNRIRAAVIAEGGLIVETYQAFLGHEAEYTSIDGVHLRPAGYQAIADLFFAKIVSTIPQSSSAFAVR